MTNSMLSRASRILLYVNCFGLGVVLGIVISSCTIPHDFGNYNTLKTICHVWKGGDGFRYQTTQHINSSENTHGSHPWDYDGECEK